jgi:uncharacterized protein (TIGR02391 family)
MIIKNRAPPQRPLVSVTAPTSSKQIRIAFNADLSRQASLQDVPYMAIDFDEMNQRVTFVSTPSREYQGSDDVAFPLMPDGGPLSSKTASRVLNVPKDLFSMLHRQAPRRYKPEIQRGRAGPRISIDLEPAPASYAESERVVRAYRDLDLHPVIAGAANKLYLDGHYANAIEAAIKALCDRVRLHSGKELDGADLMKTVFSPKNPILRFNDFRDRSDHDEQVGFMMMFAGAVTGIRNPRAHKPVKDDPERALEFIAFISLLAKLLDGAKKA